MRFYGAVVEHLGEAVERSSTAERPSGSWTWIGTSLIDASPDQRSALEGLIGRATLLAHNRGEHRVMSEIVPIYLDALLRVPHARS